MFLGTNKEQPPEHTVQNHLSTFTNNSSTINMSNFTNPINRHQSAQLFSSGPGEKLPDALKKIAWLHEFVAFSDTTY